MDQLILGKARELFFTYGLKSVSMDDLAKVAGVSKKTIYQFFSDKNALVGQTVEDLVRCHHKLFKACRAESKDAVEEVLKQSGGPFGTWTSVSPGFFYELQKFFPATWTLLEQHRDKVLLPGIVRNLKWGISEGLYRQDIDPVFMGEVRMSQFSAALQPRGFTDRRVTASQLMEGFTNFYLHGITTDKGKTLLNKYLNSKNENGSSK
jgi:AcrR family transcriptional regulator